MAESEKPKQEDDAGVAPKPGFIAIPARARQEIGELTFYLEQAMRNLREVNEQLKGSSRTMPGVLTELRDIVKMTEAATVRVLEETEALVDEGRAVASLLGEAREQAAAGALELVVEPLVKVEALVERANDRAMAIMSALEFQDLTTQKVHRAFGVLEEVVARLGKIRFLVDSGQEVETPPEAAPAAAEHDGKSQQDIADELLLRFSR